jgi:hypothetical protein
LQKAVNQLNLILEELGKIRGDPCLDLDEIKDKILLAGMRRSSMKVRNYLRELRRHIRVIETRSSNPKGEQTWPALVDLLTDQPHFQFGLSARSWSWRLTEMYQLKPTVYDPAKITLI